MPVPSRFDVVLDGVGGETEQWAMGLLKPWSGAKYVTLVTPLLHNTDSMGLLNGTFQAGLSLQSTAFQVISSGSGRNLMWKLCCCSGCKRSVT